MIFATEAAAGCPLRDGHRRLLDTFRELAHGLQGSDDRLPDPVLLRALVAFLRQGMMPFARWEEAQMEGCAEVTEEAAFEHAFLNAEVDALATAVEGYGSDGPRARSFWARRIRRHVHRIEAVLELHVEKAEERASLSRIC